MTRGQYIKILESEVRKLNKEIDRKILSGEKYSKEALAHKILLMKIRQHNKNTFLSNLSSSLLFQIF